MSNVLNEEKRQQVLARGRLGWPLRRIQQETGVRRETASTYLQAAGIAVRLLEQRARGARGARDLPAVPDRHRARDRAAVGAREHALGCVRSSLPRTGSYPLRDVVRACVWSRGCVQAVIQAKTPFRGRKIAVALDFCLLIFGLGFWLWFWVERNVP